MNRIDYLYPEGELDEKEDNLTMNDVVLNAYQKHINECGLNFQIVEYKEGIIRLCKKGDLKLMPTKYFMHINDNRIFDHTKNEKLKEHCWFSLKQFRTVIYDRLYNSETGEVQLEAERDLGLSEITFKLDHSKEYNIILTAEGMGKSKTIPGIKESLDAKRAVVCFKTYEQIEDKYNMFKKFYPDAKVHVVLGIEKILNIFKIPESHWKYKKDKEKGTSYISITETLKNNKILEFDRKELQEILQLQADIMDNKISTDFIFITEDKFKYEMKYNERFVTEPLLIFDEFYPNFWIPKKNATKRDRSKRNLFVDETFNQNIFGSLDVQMIKDKDIWWKRHSGKKVILSTEIQALLFAKTHLDYNYNLIDKRTIFFDPKLTYYSIKSKCLNSENRFKFTSGFLVNEYINIGNGIFSKYNNYNLRGRNLNKEYNNKKINIYASYPHPTELSELMANFNLTYEEAVKIKIIDNVNQHIGRASGFRAGVSPTEINVFIPDTLIYHVLPGMKYIGKIVKTAEDESNIIHKIISTMYYHICNYKINYKLFLNTLMNRIKNIFKQIVNGDCLESLDSFRKELFDFRIFRYRINRVLEDINTPKSEYTLYSDLDSIERCIYPFIVINKNILV